MNERFAISISMEKHYYILIFIHLVLILGSIEFI